MEALSGVASAMAVVSLTVQLLQSANTLRTFVRDIKGASKELERLADLLECLSALLIDVHIITERQTSLQHCPLPPQTIFNCLKSCESSLGLLQEIAKKYERRQGPQVSAMRKLKHDIKFGFKIQDITSLEDRIQRDINNLNTALGANATNIQLTTLSVLLRHEQASLTSTSPSHPNQLTVEIPPRTPASSVSQQNTSLVSPRYGIHTKTCQQWISSPLHRFGIHQRKSIRQTSITDDQAHEPGCLSNEVTFASYEVIWKLLGYGVQWSGNSTYGSIMPSLRVFPIVEDLGVYNDLIQTGNIQKIQQAFRSGVLHPFTKDQDGYTLLHCAASAIRPDVCRLLLEYGVKAEFSRQNHSPLMSCLYSISHWDINEPGVNVNDETMHATYIDTLRLLLLKFEAIDDFDSNLRRYLNTASWEFYGVGGMTIIKWFWVHAVLAFHGTELVCFRVQLICMLLALSQLGLIEYDEVREFLVKYMDDQMVTEYLNGTYPLLPILIAYGESIDSKWLGDAFLDLLASLNLDVDACIAMELERHPDGLASHEGGKERVIRIIFERHRTQGAILRWEWAYDPYAPGHSVVSEFNALAGDSAYYAQWPVAGFPEWELTWKDVLQRELKRTQRFSRRTASKARKEGARTGRKLPRSKMPGTWDW